MHFTDLVDLAGDRLGGQVLDANDEFFAPKENLLKRAKPIFIEEKYTDRGKWMDGWETRRRRTPGHDWCIVGLGLAGVIRGVVIDTAFFRGNYPEQCSIDASAGGMHWDQILTESALKGDASNLFAIADPRRFTHVRLNIFPDGGVARLRVYGEVRPDWSAMQGEVDLAAVENGGIVLAASDMFFGHRHNLIMPGHPINMGDGWETKRRRGPGHDWCVVRLGAPGMIRKVEIDTAHFKGNYPDSCSLEAGASADGPWRVVLPQTKLHPDARHLFVEELCDAGRVTHVRFNIFPDGGVGRLRVWGIL
jgi:allantoicase